MIKCWRIRGTTLLEILLALGLSSFIIGALITVYLSANTAYQKLAAYTDAQYNARSVIDQIGDDIRGASGIEIAAGGSELKLITTNGDLIRYYTENNQLYRSQTTGSRTSKVPIAEKVSDLGFNLNNSLVTARIGITIDQTTYYLSSTFCTRLQK
jgi:Tfp pilus assembly protein PilW